MSVHVLLNYSYIFTILTCSVSHGPLGAYVDHMNMNKWNEIKLNKQLLSCQKELCKWKYLQFSLWIWMQQDVQHQNFRFLTAVVHLSSPWNWKWKKTSTWLPCWFFHSIKMSSEQKLHMKTIIWNMKPC